MTAQHRKPDSLDELRRFLEFLRHTWAALAGVSVLFPLSTTFLRIIPVARWSDGGFGYFPPAIVSGTATLACMFVIFWTFSQRERANRAGNAAMKALRSFLTGIASLIVYLVGHYAVRNDLYFRVFGWESGDLRWLFGDVALLVAYAGFFTFVTRAFVVLGMHEYLKAEPARELRL